MKFKKLLLAALALSPMFASAQRLIGKTDALYYNVLSGYLNTDSTNYTYAGTSAYFDSALTRTYSYDMTGYYWHSRTIRTYNGSGFITAENVQSCDTPSTWIDSTETDYTYDGSNNIIVYVNKSYNKATSSWTTISRDGYTYSGSDMATDTAYYNGGKGYGPQSVTVYTYDGSHHVTNITYLGYNGMSGTWGAFEKQNNLLNGTGTIASDTVIVYGKTGWGKYALDVMTYDGANNMLSDTSYGWGKSGPWTPNQLDTWTYSGTNMITHDSANYSAGAWNPLEHDSMSYDSHNNLMARLNSTWRFAVGRYIYTKEWVNTYTSANKIASTTTYTWNTSSSSWATNDKVDTRTLYYYDNSTIAVPYVTANAGGSVKLYPVPANTVLNIAIKWEQSQTAVIGIYDLNGRLYNQWQTTPGNSYNTNISVNNLPAGNYIMKVNGSNGMLTERFSVVH